MNLNIINKLPKEFQKYNISKIETGASKKLFYKIKNMKNSFIVTDFTLEKKDYYNHLKIYNLLSKINISIPKIIQNSDKNLLMITEDFGDLRYDKILDKYPLKDLLQYAVDTLAVLNDSIQFNEDSGLVQYNFDIFKSEIAELPKFFFPYIKLENNELINEFINIWSEEYHKINFEFFNFTHKDFNINNLILLPSQNSHLKCGIIDYQSSFWGESSWDLFSLLEDSRVLFDDQYNDYFINYFYIQNKKNFSFNDFKVKYNFLNCSRQTRLLGRWIKLSNENKNSFYSNFISITETRLRKSLKFLNNNNLSKFYNKYILK